MDLSSVKSGGKPPETAPVSELEYDAQVSSPNVNGEAKLAIGRDGLLVTSLFDAVEISYADMTALSFENYAITINTYGGDFMFSRMGSWGQPFFDALLEAYNKKVLKALFVAGAPVIEAKGNYQYSENGMVAQGAAPVRVYDNCVCILPPDLGARRIPLCFLTGMDKGDYELTLRLNTDESYTFRKLGHDTTPFADAIEKQIRILREKSLAAIKELDSSLTMAQASAIAKLMPEDVAAQVGQLAAIAPSFVSAIEEKISASRAMESYKTFQELCDPTQIYIGFKKSTSRGEEYQSVVADVADSLAGGREDKEDISRNEYILWLIAPSPDGKSCAVEFAGDSGDAAATFIYRFDVEFSTFAQQLNRALEAIDFKREVIRLSEEEMMQPKYLDYRMAVQRNSALQFVRACFAGRVIHRGKDVWKQSLVDFFDHG